MTVVAPRQRRFLQLAASGHLYHTEDWKPKHEALYLPVENDLLVSTANIEQISFSSGNFFVANHSGVYCDSLSGKLIMHAVILVGIMMPQGRQNQLHYDVTAVCTL